ncbi:MAG: hypothetical protein NT165_01240 [Candidatus Falkowbacteria bacterium]|nr:hypothetical protein [Candidatus Falkowbacteria bacterium]
MSGFSSFSEIVAKKKSVKAPAYPWQDLALSVIKELAIPNFKRGSVFKVCKEKTPEEIRRAITDTKELCQAGEKWKYFFKVIEQKYEKNPGSQNFANRPLPRPYLKKNLPRTYREGDSESED